MKLKHAQQIEAYRFQLTFADGQVKETDLQALIGQFVAVNELSTVAVNLDWGCLEFLDGQVDIEPITLARYAEALQSRDAA
ncbi:hypothetical protein [Chromatium okenii]|jgi:hypothetical protein|uniref:hypothetical protein n=1 Tax=Chromatium okenii TaxID=61644 RepID=UPI0026F2F96E|nr:hypothetical protein [Chromatium okenii]MBV5311397.1 hypothetical protein [Chromatium okenii]